MRKLTPLFFKSAPSADFCAGRRTGPARGASGSAPPLGYLPEHHSGHVRGGLVVHGGPFAARPPRHDYPPHRGRPCPSAANDTQTANDTVSDIPVPIVTNGVRIPVPNAAGTERTVADTTLLAWREPRELQTTPGSGCDRGRGYREHNPVMDAAGAEGTAKDILVQRQAGAWGCDAARC